MGDWGKPRVLLQTGSGMVRCILSTILVSWGFCNKLLQLGGLKQQKCILSQFWRPEVWNQRVGRVTLPREDLEDNPPVTLPAFGSCQRSLTWGCISLVSASVVTLLPPCCVFHAVSYKDICIRFRAHPDNPSHLKVFNSIIYAKTLSPHKVTAGSRD